MKPRIGTFLLFTLIGSVLLTGVDAIGQTGTKKDQEKERPDKKGPGFGKGGPGGFGGMMGQRRKLVKDFDKDGDGRLNKEERKAAREFLKKGGGGRGGFRPGGPGGPGGPGRGPGGPGGFNLGTMLSKPLLEALDSDKDDKLTQDEVVAGVKKFFTDCDKDKKGSLTEEQLAEGLNRIFPRPPGGPGGPGGGPGGGFGPGTFIAGTIFRRADADKDGKVTLKELTAAAEAVFKEADKDKTGKLDETKLGTAIASVVPAPGRMGGPGGGPGGFGPPGGPGGFGPPGGPGGFGGRGNREPAKPGVRIKPDEVTAYPKAALYEPTVLRTFFLEFEDKDWEAELADFYHTDVEVPATLIVDGKRYPNVGVRFRGNSSYFRVGAGYKRSINLTLDFVDKKQRLYGYKTINLLNSADDPSFMNTVLYSRVGRNYIPVPNANLARVAINGESWGIYVNTQQFNKEFTQEFFKDGKGVRWKVPGHPGAGGGLEYIGENIEAL